ncbi:saccharopine dehydrogenase NADP-binding domain-containing protein [Aurantiacibacter sp. MUD11]|uniref:saccharopine dehydrogenase family protein n=1 Tax=Aurantiacibacter sp. MUD11 TaxID=3003265 RepID=UPI0022AB4A24|nr:saccharopine dehydrogenase NADP-binding domain-containing protein [Aurantiacibacter sp. MUD11]WAT17708.1 saccharopine dehydrogenase NADP-binding domain-containing protein [Aurantiacibacter sp. MUD11]
MTEAAQFDLVIYGATSFVGAITAENILARYGVGRDVRWAIAARSPAKLAALKERLGEAAADLPTIIANSDDEASLAAMCAQTRLVISTVGPYALYGEKLVKTCASSRTHYCDLTGEVQWIAAMIEKYEAAARESGALIVNCCGFDSIPSDLGTYFLQKHALETAGSTCETVELGVQAAKGGFSGGTVASLINVLKEAGADPALRKKLADPYLLCPDDYPNTARQRTEARYYSDALRSWCAPFVMAGINTRVVQRSNALQNNRYGENFRYSEYTMTGDGPRGRLRSIAMTLGMGGFMGVLALSPTRWLAEKFLPKPGEGPSKEAREAGFFKIKLAGTTASRDVVSVRVTGDRDPGYGSTAKMLSEAALCILETAETGQNSGGFWTPAALMGDALIERLEANAGLTFEAL